MGGTVEWCDFVSFRNILLTHNFCIMIIIIDFVPPTDLCAIIIFIILATCRNLHYSSLLQSCPQPLSKSPNSWGRSTHFSILALSASPFHLPHHPSRIVHFKIESKCPFLANMGPHLTGLTYFPGLAARIIILRQKKEISIPLQHRASPHRVYLLSLMIPRSKFFLQKKNKFNSALANIESRPHLTSQGWPTSRYWLHQPSLHLLPLDLLSHHPNWL